MLYSSQMVQMRLSVFLTCMTGALALKLQSSSVEPNTFVGGGGKDLSKVQCICTEEEPICLFQNLCYDKEEGGWAFHIAPDSDAPEFPDGINLAAIEFLHAHPGQRTEFKPRVVRSNEHQQITNGVYGLLDGNPFGNMGHILGDQTWPFFQAARHFDLNPRDVKILTTFQPLENQGGVYESLNGHSEINSLQGGKFCVSKLLAGIGGLGYSTMMKYPDVTGEKMKCLKEKPFDSEFLQFSTYLAQRFAAVTRPQPHQLRILLTRKDVGHSDHEQILGNTGEISEHLRQRFPHADVQVATWMGMPLEEQVRLVASTDIFISLPGSDAMNGAFLLNNTEMIVPCRYAGVESGGVVDGLWNSGEVDNWFRWASHIKAVEICSDHARRTRHPAWGNQIPTGRNWTTSEKGGVFSVIVPVEDIDVHVDAAVARLRAKGAIV